MSVEIKVPTLGESVTEATVGQWFKKVGDQVAADEPLLELETDKVTLEVPAPTAGVIEAIAVKDGQTVGVGAVLGTIAANGAGAAAAAAKTAPAPTGRPDQKTETARPIGAGPEAVKPRSAEAAKVTSAPAKTSASGPAVAKLVVENNLDPSRIAGSGRDGRPRRSPCAAPPSPPRRRPERIARWHTPATCWTGRSSSRGGPRRPGTPTARWRSTAGSATWGGRRPCSTTPAGSPTATGAGRTR